MRKAAARTTYLSFATGIALSALLLHGCGSEDAASEPVGSVSLPLSASANGIDYRLSPARLRVSGVSDPDFVQTYNASEQDVFRADLTPGQYELELLSGWVLNEGAAPVVDRVVLESPNPVPFEVDAGAVTQVTFVFGIGDSAISFGNGQVAVDIDVNDRRLECAEDGDCDDGDLCTIDECREGACVAAPVDCSDGNSCTSDSCDPSTGACTITNVSNGTLCDLDGTLASCLRGTCFVCTSNGSCSDSNSCTTDVCSIGGLCSYTTVDNGTSCTTPGGGNGTCFLGQCQPDLGGDGGPICQIPPCF